MNKGSNILLIALTMVFICYASDLNAQKAPKKSKLQVTIIDGEGSFVEGATVTLYKSQEDYQKSTNAIKSGTTDSKGRVRFKELKPMIYFIDARKDDLTNDGRGVQSGSLEPAKMTKVNIVIE